MKCFAARPNSTTIPIIALCADAYSAWSAKQDKRVTRWLASVGFKPQDGALARIPGHGKQSDRVILGLGEHGDMWSFAAACEALSPGRYQLETTAALEYAAALGWALAAYRFDRYKTEPGEAAPTLVWPSGVDRASVTSTARAIYLGRDLVNTPAGDLGPAELAKAVRALGREYGAKVSVIRGEALLAKNYPAIHAVGRAASVGREPCLADLRWGKARAPKLTLVGKGVVFDSGGLDLKPADGMRLMKKDMGGAAGILALAQMIMAAELPVRLRVLIPAVENAVAGNAYRPGDVLTTRSGTTVEIGNTDAEGRVILCDALAEAAREKPDLIIDMATLTGAARVALGTEVPALFCTEREIADATVRAGELEPCADPVWHMPLYAPYRRLLSSKIADLCNISSTRYGGAITAALFLREFVGDCRWIHVDTMAFNDNPQAGRPHGGEVLGARALFGMLEERYRGS